MAKSIVKWIITLVFLIIIGITVGYVFLWMTQPNIIISDVTKNHATGLPLPQTVGAEFTLTNTGQVDGIVSVKLTGGGRTLADNTYIVKAGESIKRSLQTDVVPKSKFEVNVWIDKVQSI